ncbi:hypothetical protein F5X68DRAFT_257970 [Plectosphaerella plurivora]|uniref:Zinc finger PHD-type domain-containing protein n=1 Tax=Plectosphaerella plurivora TaxID=936078 RepID=A0A9P9ACE0_9PEZI|nr:hypothetical protein F5X68DRAFT_257970 [Plectosphaerella plurivora]
MDPPSTPQVAKAKDDDRYRRASSVRPPVPQRWDNTDVWMPRGAKKEERIPAPTDYKPQFDTPAVIYLTPTSGTEKPPLDLFAEHLRFYTSHVTFPPPRKVTYGAKGAPDFESLPKTVELPPAALNPPTKRKRGEGEEGQPAGAERVAPTTVATPVAKDFPVIEKPVVRKKKKSCADAILVCDKCHTTSNVNHNPMMVCKGCFEALHKHCCEPAQDPRDYLCMLCSKEREDLEQYSRLVAEQQAEKQLSRAYYSVENQRRRNLVGFPQFNKPQHLGFFAGDSTHEERAEYFSKFKVNELVNLLIFAEEHVEGGVLANLLASVAKKHSDLPIFNRPDWVNDFRPVEEQPQEASTVPTGAKAQATTSLRKPKNKRHRISAIRKVQDGVATFVEPLIYDVDVHTLPGQWPRPREGLYALLKPEKDDTLMFDDMDEQAFSHFKGPIDSGPPVRPTYIVHTTLVPEVPEKPLPFGAPDNGPDAMDIAIGDEPRLDA